MKVLQVTAAYKPAYVYGGPTMSVSKLSEELVKGGVKVEVFTTTANGNEELPVIRKKRIYVDGVPVRYFERITKDHSHFSPQLLVRLWKEVRSFDVVHIHAWWNLVSVLSCLIAILRNVPVVLSPRGTLSPYSFSCRHVQIKKMFHQWLGRPLLNRCFIHVTAEREHMAISAILRPKGIFTLYNFVKLSPADVATVQQGSAVLKLLFFSRIDQKKGLELLFKALATAVFPYELTIAGSAEADYIEELKQLSKYYQIEKHIKWIGFVATGKFNLLAAHEVLVLPSYDENFANVVIESLSVGTAVLLTENVGLAKYVEHHHLGWISETSAVSLLEQLNRISNDPEKLASVRKLAPGIIMHDFNESLQLKQYLDMYHQIHPHKH
ncbi:XrtY-associated glycosyltransferase XYAG1 [Pedobacter sp. AW31-3R]|uniref:XrtY-associated glycosyltransferase XYAG1 n=1 Tax=Pedobacter sp. AW31-3R TaxID=3445781 RepID=UPI003F9F7ED8